MPPKKRRSLSEAVGDLFKPAQGRAPRPADELTRATSDGLMELAGEDTTPRNVSIVSENPLITETKRYHGKDQLPQSRDYVIPVGSGRHLYYNEFAPKPAMEFLQGDSKDAKRMRHFAEQWMAPGGDRFAEYLFADYMWKHFGMWDNINLTPVDLKNSAGQVIPFSDYNHYFNWARWKAEYSRLKG